MSDDAENIAAIDALFHQASIGEHPDLPSIDFDRGERWIVGMDKTGKRSIAPYMKQRDGETLNQFMARVVEAEAACGKVWGSLSWGERG